MGKSDDAKEPGLDPKGWFAEDQAFTLPPGMTIDPGAVGYPKPTFVPGPPQIYGAIKTVMTEMNAIAKSGYNSQQKFKFQKVEDIYNELHRVFGQVGVFTVPEVLSVEREVRSTKSGGTMMYTVARIRFTFYAQDGSSFRATTVGEGSDSGDKSANKAMTAAHKYALIQIFCIPTQDLVDDADGGGDELGAKEGPQKDVDPIASAPIAPPPSPPPPLTGAQKVAKISAIRARRNIEPAVLKDYIRAAWPKENMGDLSVQAFKNIVAFLDRDQTTNEAVAVEVKRLRGQSR